MNERNDETEDRRDDVRESVEAADATGLVRQQEELHVVDVESPAGWAADDER